MRKKLCFLISFVLLVALSGLAKAEPLDVPNFSFEYGYENPDEPNEDPNTWVQLLGHTGIEDVAAWQTGEGSKGWIGVDVDCNVSTPAPVDEDCKTWFTATDAYAICYMQHTTTGSIMYQVLDHTIVEGELYTLKWDGMGWGNDMVASLFYLEYDEANEVNVPVYISSDVFLLDPKDPEVWNGWLIDLTSWAVVLPESGAVGKQLGIEYKAIGDGGYGFVENVRLDRVLASSAYFPKPADGAVNVGLETSKLSWDPGIWAQPTNAHDVYFGTSFEDVNIATPGNPLGVYKDRFDANSWPLDIALEIAQTYYWRVDEVNDSHPDKLWRGSVWSFKANDGTASSPSPSDRERDVDPEVVLSWSPGIAAVSHDVYFGTSFEDVNDANNTLPEGVSVYKGIQDACSYDAGAEEDLELAKTYYWRIDEINDSHPAKLWRGSVWSFRVTDYLEVETFDAYASDSTLIAVWEDGAENYLSGSEIHPENIIVRTEGDAANPRSIRFLYRNFDYTEKFSEIVAETYSGSGSSYGYLDFGRDWNEFSAHTLVLWFYGQEDNIASSNDVMYIALEDTSIPPNVAVVEYYGDMNDIKIEEWQEWNIPLDEFTGVDLNDVQYVYIGFGKRGSTTTPGGTGNVYFDDLRLHTTRCVPKLAYLSGSFGHLDADCTTDYLDLAMLSRDWLRQAYEVEAIEPVSGPNRWYELNDDLIDSGTDGLDGTMPAAPNDPEFTSGGYDGSTCLYFDNDSKNPDYVYIPPFGLNTDSLTITTWLKGDMGEDTLQDMYAGIVWMRDSNTNSGVGLCFGADDVEWENNNELTYCWDELYWDWHSGLIVPEGEWVFVAVVVEADQATLYLDEAEASSEVLRRAINPAPHHIIEDTYNWLAKLADDLNGDETDPNDMDGNCFRGWMDDVRIYNRALTTGEVLYLAQGSEAPSYFLHLDKFRADANKDDIVDFKDYAIMADYWLQEIWFPFP